MSGGVMNCCNNNNNTYSDYGDGSKGAHSNLNVLPYDRNSVYGFQRCDSVGFSDVLGF